MRVLESACNFKKKKEEEEEYHFKCCWTNMKEIINWQNCVMIDYDCVVYGTLSTVGADER